MLTVLYIKKTGLADIENLLFLLNFNLNLIFYNIKWNFHTNLTLIQILIECFEQTLDCLAPFEFKLGFI